MSRAVTALVFLAGAGPPIAVALHGAGVPVALALAGVMVVGLLAAAGVVHLPALPLERARQHPVMAALWAIALCASLVQVVRASVFAEEVRRREYSVAPSDRFRSQHNCLTAYAEAARFARQGGVNIYDRSLYRPGRVPRLLGPLTVDPYHYPPPFLLLPAAVRAVAPEFFDTRRVWFGLQVIALLGAVLATARWIGGETGVRVALATVAVWAAPTTYMALQVGNFQITAIAIAMMGMLLAPTRHVWSGGALLAYAAAGKIFPSMLVLHVLATRRWRVVAAIAIAGVALAGATLALFGLDPFLQFLRDEVPQLASGAAFPQTEDPAIWVVNLSIYGLTVKLRALGLHWLEPSAGRAVAQVYAVLLAALVVWAGLRAGRDDEARSRLSQAAAWLGILNLASFASPFVGGAYGAVGTTWLLALLAGGASSSRERWGWLAAFAVATWIPWVTPSPASVPAATAGMLLLSSAWQVGAVLLNAWAVWPSAAGMQSTARAVRV